MVVISALSRVMGGRVGHLLDELTAKYVPANARLTGIDILFLERGYRASPHGDRKDAGTAG